MMSILPKGTPRKTTHSTAQSWTEAWGRGRVQNLLLLPSEALGEKQAGQTIFSTFFLPSPPHPHNF